MSARRPWPEGVPPLPTSGVFRRFLLVRGAWENDPYMKASLPRDVAKATETIDTPSVILRGEKIIHANAAARALGILLDSEQEPPR